ncbi:hypothetical protein [Streptomyces sp. SLBN-118]|uniref:hypothetical protein n=1 Tax=Streptomyces sp. SLBN-118 TaxID=2768454 RepID=UPI001C92DB51|nr:hypothetical protein [Streptomyces sp. SLBN-118]
MALRLLALLTALPGGTRLVAAFLGRFRPPTGLRVGAVVPVAHARDALRVLPALGATVIEVGPVGSHQVPAVRAALAGRRCEVIVRAEAPDVAAALGPDVDRVVTGPEPDLVHLNQNDPDDCSVERAVAALADPAATVLATTDLLVATGPGWFRRVMEAATPTEPAQRWQNLRRNPLRWPSWAWGVLVGLGMIGAGMAAAAITLGPLLLWYDSDYLGATRDDLHELNHHLVHFLQHDRITLAGTMVSIGILYTGLAWGGIRHGWLWARDAYLISGAVGLPTVFYFLGTGFVEPFHTALTAVLFPLLLLTVWRSPARPRWSIQPDAPEPLRRRALTGQLLMILTGTGLLIGGATISVVGLTRVFVPTDLVFLGADAAHLHAAGPHLIPFIAHDRAGFGGALLSAAIAIILISAWGWRRGASWVWWTLLLAAAFGFGPTIVIHHLIHYTDAMHLAPVYAGTVLTTAALTLARPYLCSPTSPTDLGQDDIGRYATADAGTAPV